MASFNTGKVIAVLVFFAVVGGIYWFLKQAKTAPHTRTNTTFAETGLNEPLMEAKAKVSEVSEVSEGLEALDVSEVSAQTISEIETMAGSNQESLVPSQTITPDCDDAQ